jgi:hypothetical protein
MRPRFTGQGQVLDYVKDIPDCNIAGVISFAYHPRSPSWASTFSTKFQTPFNSIFGRQHVIVDVRQLAKIGTDFDRPRYVHKDFFSWLITFSDFLGPIFNTFNKNIFAQITCTWQGVHPLDMHGSIDVDNGTARSGVELNACVL